MAGDSRLPNLPRDAAVSGRERLIGRTQNVVPASLPRGAPVEGVRRPVARRWTRLFQHQEVTIARLLEGQVQMPGWLNLRVGRDIHHGYC
jgi:hypothetical protein